MRYAGLNLNDIAAAPGVCVSFFTQGCPHRCPGCQNPETWDFDGGKEFSMKTMSDLLNGLSANGIERPLCIMGGEPLCNENLFLTSLIVKMVKENKPNTKIYLWTGYLYEDLKNKVLPQSRVEFILNNIDYLIDGPYIEAERDITLPMRGSRNQRIIDLTEKK
jgi:anaerobic ribonucleoside-triphosphate reductase activating protein